MIKMFLFVALAFTCNVYSQDFWQLTNGPGGGVVFSLAQNFNGYIFAATDSGVFRSSDNGNIWTRTINGVPPVRVYNIAANNAGNIFVVIWPKGAFRSTDDGNTWVHINNGLTDSLVYNITVNSNGDIYLAQNHEIYRSTNNGNNWVQVYSQLYTRNFYCNPKGYIFAGGNWLQINSGLTDSVIYSLLIDRHGFIFAGSEGGLVFRSAKSTTGVKDNISLAKFFVLNQNYPNPFNPSTVISYSLPSASNVKLIVYNALGQTVKLLENSYQQPGNYSVSFNASALPSGIYFYKLEAGQFSQIKKMILLK